MYANPPPAYYNNAPHYPVKYKKRSGGRSSCCRCICCCCCFLFLVFLLTIAAILAVYHVYDPKLPAYEVSDLQVKALDMKLDSSVNTEMELSVRADNPNKRIGFVYGDDNSIDVTFKDVVICSGKVPGFHQGTENTTLIKINLKGKATFDEGMQKAYNDSRTRHRIPLLLKIKVPVNLVVGEVLLRQIKAFVNSNIVLDDLAPNSKVKILSKETSAHFEL